ncbi:sialate O-acetylesterase [Pseudooceanicola sp. MF1-13]|uniref:sialate O-acetylesterase n=1 Tax=Pseudooceanicola sp. MF1-13 TaxID=3379095 RepID=UPI003891955F
MIFATGPIPQTRSHGPAVPVTPRTCVLLALGQSNMVDQSPADGTPWPATVQAMDTQTLAYAHPGTGPLTWLENNPGSSADWQSGPGQQVKTFARHWCAAHPHDTLIVVPCARGGTGFLDGAWPATGAGRLYNETIRLLDQVFADHPGAEFTAVLIQNGERDGNMGNVLFQFDLMRLIAGLRTRYTTPDLPVIVGEPGPTPAFTANDTPAHDLIRAHIRRSPDTAAHLAVASAVDPEGFETLQSVGDGLHFDHAAQKALGMMDHRALWQARLRNRQTLPDVALVWQSHDGGNWDAMEFVCDGVEAGDTLVVLTAANLASAAPLPTAMAIEGEALTLHLTQSVTQDRLLGLAVGSVTLAATPATDLLTLTASWTIAPAGGALSIWRVRGGLALDAPRIDWAADQSGAPLAASPATSGPVAMMAYAVNGAGEVSFTGDGTALVRGAGGRPSTYFATHLIGTPSGPVSMTPSTASDKVCGMIAVTLG